MGVAIPQVIAEDRASGAQIIDGSLKFNRSSNNYLKKTISTTGNQRTFTISGWIKQCRFQDQQYLFTSEYLGTGNEYFELTLSAGYQLQLYNSKNTTVNIKPSTVLRDTAWYHIVVAVDTTIASPTEDRVKFYINGERQTDFAAGHSAFPSQNYAFELSNSKDWLIGAAEFSNSIQGHYDGPMTNFYFIDGAALGPEEFGFSDSLTNTWRPKKYTGEFARSSPNDGTWNATSSLSTTDSISSSTPAGNAFDGDLTTRVQTTNAQAGIALTFAPNNAGINFTTSLEVYCDQGTNVPTATWNGNTVNPGQNQWVTVYSGSGELSSTYPLTINTETAIQYATLVGVRVDGEILIDGLNNTGVNSFHLPMDGNSPVGEDKSGNGNDWTPVKFGGSVPLDNPIASGALPILNTTQGGTQATVSVRTDAHANNLFLAMPLLDTNGDVSNQINSGSITKAVSVTNAITSNLHSNFYSGSYYFDGNTDYITVTDNAELEPGTGDFCYEGWFYSSTLASGTFLLFDSTQGTGVYFYTTSGSLYLYLGNSQVASDYACLANNKWTHIAFVRESGTGKIFCDGVLVGSGSKSDSVAGGNLVIGSSVGGGNYFTGYMQDIRVYVGTSKYTSNFIPASTNPDILPDTPSGVSGGSKLAKITEGAVAFDGNGDSLRVEDHVDFTFGGGDYTMEAFVYMDSNSTGYNALVTKYSTNTQSDRSWWWGLNNGRQEFYHQYNNGLNNLNTTSPKVIYGKWTHCAVAREGNTIRIFDDGQLSATIDLSSVPASQTMTDGSGPLVIGQDADSNTYDMGGFISNVRVIKGTALYTSNFTPPTEPLTNVTNTKLLCCQSNTSAGAAAVSPNISGLNNGTVWSDYLTTTQGANPRDFYTGNNYPATNLFDGETSSIVYGGWIDDADDNSDLIFSPPSGISVSSKLEVYVGYYDKIKVNGTTYNTGGQSTAQAWVTVSDGSNFTGTLTNLHLENRSNANVVRAAAIRIDDSTILLDPVIAKGNTVATNFNPFNTDTNTVRGQETGYCTFNVLRERTAGYNPSFSDGNLFMDGRGDGTGTLSASSGKFYYEVLIDTVTNNSQMYIGVQDAAYSGTERGWSTAQIAAIRDQAAFYGDGSTGTAVGYGAGDLLSFAFDADDNKLYIAKNGIYMNGGNPSQGTGFTHSGINFAGGYTPLVSDSNVGQKFRVNFGQNPFKFPPPDGFQPLNAANIRPETVIARPDQYVGVTTYTGNNTVGRIIDIGRNADLVWVKKRTAENHILVDTVRGANNFLMSDTTDTANTSGGPITGIGATVYNGFIVDNNGYVNASDSPYVCWNWKAGGS